MSRKENPKVSEKKIVSDFHIEDKAISPVCDPLVIWGFCFFLSFVYLLICTKSSPLYPLNDSVDANAFFTMGKGMMNGKILYRDLFEQKGPLLYFIHGLSYLISNKSFLGVYLFEVISFSFFLFFSHKTLSLFIDHKYSLIYLPIITTLILNLKCFSHGDNAEEFCLPLIAISLYYLIIFFKNDAPQSVSHKWLFWNGIIAGCVLWIKFSLLGFWIVWIASILFISLIKKRYLGALKEFLFFLFGVFIATLPWIVYFGVNQSISEWINAYLILNLTSYSISTSFLSHFVLPVYAISNQFYFNPFFNGLLWLGVIVFIRHGKFIKSRLYRISLLLSVLFLVLGVYGGGRWYVYYYLIISPLIVLGVIVLQDLINSKNHKVISPNSTVTSILITLLITIPITLIFNQNTYMLKIKKEDLVQYKYASIINQSKNPTLLNYGTLDLGFYTTTGITPNIRFFIRENFIDSKFPVNMDEQNRYIREKTVEYVVIQQRIFEQVESLNIPYLFDYYKLIESEKQAFENTEYNFLLFKLNN